MLERLWESPVYISTYFFLHRTVGDRWPLNVRERPRTDAQGMAWRDADRMTALQAMGYDVLLLTHRQISDEDRFRAIVKAVCRMLDAEYRDKSSDEQRAEALLRSELFVDWTKLGVIDGKMPARHKMARSWTAAVLSE